MQLAELQAMFAGALRGEPPPGLLQAIAAVPSAVPAAERLAIYRRTSRHGQRAALAAVYPVVQALIGEDLFEALVLDHLAMPGSRHGNLHRLGARFDRTLLAEPACAPLIYLADVARLEWALHDSFFAADQSAEALLDPAGMDAAEQLRVALVLHPSTHLLACEAPAHHIWQAHQPDSGSSLDAVDVRAGPVWLAVYRRPEGHCIMPLTAAEHVLLENAKAGDSLAHSLERLEQLQLGVDLPAALARWLPAGLLQGFTLR